MPGDITGSVVYDPKTGSFEFREGPVFTNLLLADEINRTPPKTQSALLEAMEERQVSADGVTRKLPTPFLVAATQNPIEYEGTYTLPEAQLDRFLLKLVLDLPRARGRGRGAHPPRRRLRPARPRRRPGVTPVLDAATLRRPAPTSRTVPVSADVLGYAVDLARGTRQSPSVRLGVSPRGTTALLAASRAWAWLSGAAGVTPDHIQAMALPVLRHRIQLRPEAELEGVGRGRGAAIGDPAGARADLIRWRSPAGSFSRSAWVRSPSCCSAAGPASGCGWRSSLVAGVVDLLLAGSPRAAAVRARGARRVRASARR